MARVHRKDDLLVVQYVTGPQHVYLGIKFSCDPVTPTIVKLPAVGACSHGELDQGQLIDAVIGVAEEHGLHVERVEYVANDSPNYEIYRHCTRLLAKQAAAEASRPGIPPSDAGA